MRTTGVSTTHRHAIQIFNTTIQNSFWFNKMKKVLHNDILFWQYCVQYGLGVFHAKHHKYINISHIRANEDSWGIYAPHTSYSNIQYDYSNLSLIQEHEKGAT